jgi:hypothetical protein
MKNDRWYRLLPAAVLLVLSVRCDGIPGLDSVVPGLLYVNSFEIPADTSGWKGYAGIRLARDAPPVGGLISAHVAGGCIVPHAFVDIPGPEKDSYLVLACWGKNLALGGGVSLSLTRSAQRAVSISITDTVWTSYRSPDTLFCPAGDSLRIAMTSGGIVASAMRVDIIEIWEVQ